MMRHLTVKSDTDNASGKSHRPIARAPESEATSAHISAASSDTGGMQRASQCACGGGCSRCSKESAVIQTKLKVGAPGDEFEREADRMADQVMRMPQSHTHANESHSKQSTPLLQPKAQTDKLSPAPAKIETQIDALRGRGEPLSQPLRDFFEPRFNQDFSRVRIHTDRHAAESARTVNARAYTIGQDVVFGEGQYAVETAEGQRLLAHELAHVRQQSSKTIIRRDAAPDAGPAPAPAAPVETENLKKLRKLLQDDDEDDAISLMGKLGEDEVKQVFASREFKELAISSFNNKEMYRGVKAMKGDLYPSLEWMFDEGTDWDKVRDVVVNAPSGKERVRADGWMKKQFADICDNEEMAEAVDLLEGTLLEKLIWMKEEGANWKQVKAKINATKEPKEKVALYDSDEARTLFLDVCDDIEMAEAVKLLGGSLLQKLRWMLAEGTNNDLVYALIRITDPKEFPDVTSNKDVMDGLESELSKEGYRRVKQMLTQGLLKWEEKSYSITERHYERDDATSPWEIEKFSWKAKYEIRYTRTELRIIVRIKTTGVPRTPAMTTTWTTGIQNRWNNQFHIENDRRLAVVFEPIFTDSNPNHEVEIHNPPAKGVPREDMENFFTTTSGDAAAHEFGHMIGLEDEYRLTAAEFLRITGAAPTPADADVVGFTVPGLMDTGAGPVQGRHLAPFLAWLNKNRLAGEKPYKLVAGP